MDLRASLRLVRAVLITGMATSLAATGHILGGGALPEPQLLAALATLLLVPGSLAGAPAAVILTLLGVSEQGS